MTEDDLLLQLALVARLYPDEPEQIRIRVADIAARVGQPLRASLERVARLVDPCTAINRILAS